MTLSNLDKDLNPIFIWNKGSLYDIKLDFII